MMTDLKSAPVSALPQNPVVLIPARMASTRLPNKPLADIHGKPMILHVLDRAKEAGYNRIVIAAGDKDIVDVVTAAGGEAVMTDPDLPSGSDRIMAALNDIDPAKTHDGIINLQGDSPTLNKDLIDAAFHVLENHDVDIGTLVTPIITEDQKNNPNIVKAVLEMSPEQKQGRALYFSRTAVPWGDGPLYYHLGIYTYRRDALERFVQTPASVLEQREKLEQLRALALGMRLDAAVVDTVPLGVDTPEDLEKARELLA